MRYDVVVGAGTAGLCAGIRLAEAGRRVLVLATGAGATRLAPGTVDVLARRADGSEVPGPGAGLVELRGLQPGHPYARLSTAAVSEALAWFVQTVAPLRYEGGLERNMLLPTAVGAVRPTAYAPASLRAGDVELGGRVLLVGFRALKDFYAGYAAANLQHTAPGLRVEAIELSTAPADDRDPGTLGLARRFEDPAFRDAVVSELRARMAPGQRIGFPAVLGLAQVAEVRAELEERLRASVFEISTLPPSAPGLRLFETLKAALRQAGGRLVIGGPVVGAESHGRRVQRVFVQAAGRQVAYESANVVLATGGFAAGGLVLDSRGEVRETVLGLPVSGLPREGRPRFSPGVQDPQPLAHAGIAVDRQLRAAGPDGEPLYENVYVAGALVAGAEPVQECSGEGISVTTGHAAASAILEAPAAAAVLARSSVEKVRA